MPREVFIKVGRYARKIVDGRGVSCKVCGKIVNYDPVTKQEIRHSCQLPDHHDYVADQTGAVVWDDEDCDEAVDYQSQASRIARGFYMRGYGDNLDALAGIAERW